MIPVALRANARTSPLGIDDPHPRLSWSADGTSQAAAWDVDVATDEAFGTILWSARDLPVESQMALPYVGDDLHSSTTYWWRVRGVTAGGEHQAWARSWFETGYLTPSEWTAAWIGKPFEPGDDAPLYLRGEFELGAEAVERARITATALGWYQLFVNGHAVSGSDQIPRFTPFDDVLEYQTFDISSVLRSGVNVIAIVIGDGRFRGRLGAEKREVYGDRLAALAQLDLTFHDGSTRRVQTNDGWTQGSGPIRSSDTKGGERIDLRVDGSAWKNSPTPPPAFTPVEVIVPTMQRALIAEEVERVRDVMELTPTSITRTSTGSQIIAFDQNFTGVLRIRLAGESGRLVTLTHSELLDRDGNLDTHYVIGAASKNAVIPIDEITLDGSPQWVQPAFTIHGFQYVEVTGLDHDLPLDDVRGVVLSTDLETRASFSSSDARLEQLFRNVQWSLRGNFVDTATDCPTRERRGWTGDIQVFAPTASILVDAQAYLERYLRNLAFDQGEDGTVPAYIPQEGSSFSSYDGGAKFGSGAAGWADVAVLTPWDVYQYTGDPRVLERQWDSAKKWVDYRVRQAADKRGRARWFARAIGGLEKFIVGGGLHYGEWLRPGETMIQQIRHIIAPNPAIATAYFARSARTLSQMADVLGREKDALHYAALADNVTRAWQKAFVRKGGARIGQDRQDEYVRALAFDLLPQHQHGAAAARLAELIVRNDDHLATGFLSTPFLLRTLAAHGYPDIAYRLLLQTSNPSWLSQVEKGATTVWETWEGYDNKGNGKDSHNHYALGTVAQWLVEGLAGISPASPGYRTIRIAPVIEAGLQSAAATVTTPFGPASSSWRKEADRTVTLDVTIPQGTIGLLNVADDFTELPPGEHRVTLATRAERSEAVR